jgi:hypothetical protein
LAGISFNISFSMALISSNISLLNGGDFIHCFILHGSYFVDYFIAHWPVFHLIFRSPWHLFHCSWNYFSLIHGSHFQKRKCALLQMKNSNKIAEKIGMVCTVGNNVRHSTVCISKYGMCGYAK